MLQSSRVQNIFSFLLSFFLCSEFSAVFSMFDVPMSSMRYKSTIECVHRRRRRSTLHSHSHSRFIVVSFFPSFLVPFFLSSSFLPFFFHPFLLLFFLTLFALPCVSPFSQRIHSKAVRRMFVRSFSMRLELRWVELLVGRWTHGFNISATCARLLLKI